LKLGFPVAELLLRPLLTVPNSMPSEMVTPVWCVRSSVTIRRREGIHAEMMLVFITTWVRIQGEVFDHVWSSSVWK